MDSFPPRRQWVAIAMLAAIVLSILLGRFYYRDSVTSDLPLKPVIVGVEGDVRKPGIYLLEGPEVTVSGVMEAAGSPRGDLSEAVPTEIAARRIRTGQTIRVSVSEQGSVEVGLEAMPAAARLTLGEKLNVNTASEEELMLVPQMRAGFAAAIVNRHPKTGWRSLDDLEEIPGVGPRTVEKWRNYLEVTDPGTGGLHEEHQ